MESSVDNCLELRRLNAATIAKVVQQIDAKSEADCADTIKTNLHSADGVLPSGWYTPPPDGVGVLFGSAGDNYQRARFESLRKEEFWPSDAQNYDTETVAILYASPISENSGIIGDWGGTFYRGTNPKIQQHIRACLDVVERLAEYAQEGMEYGEISRYADTLLVDRGLSTDRTLLVTKPEATGTNCGHTIPWTSNTPTKAEAAILSSRDQAAIVRLISNKRLFINADETTKIPNNGAFTTELRLESVADTTLPNVLFHLIVAFKNGNKTIHSDYNDFFSAVGMDYVRSKY